MQVIIGGGSKTGGLQTKWIFGRIQSSDVEKKTVWTRGVGWVLTQVIGDGKSWSSLEKGTGD